MAAALPLRWWLSSPSLLLMTANMLLLGAVVSYPVFRLSFTVRAIRADRRGDIERGRELRALAFKMMLGAVMLFLVLAMAAAMAGI